MADIQLFRIFLNNYPENQNLVYFLHIFILLIKQKFYYEKSKENHEDSS